MFQVFRAAYELKVICHMHSASNTGNQCYCTVHHKMSPGGPYPLFQEKLPSGTHTNGRILSVPVSISMYCVTWFYKLFPLSLHPVSIRWPFKCCCSSVKSTSFLFPFTFSPHLSLKLFFFNLCSISLNTLSWLKIQSGHLPLQNSPMWW